VPDRYAELQQPLVSLVGNEGRTLENPEHFYKLVAARTLYTRRGTQVIGLVYIRLD
jgi:hypothetical protein